MGSSCLGDSPFHLPLSFPLLSLPKLSPCGQSRVPGPAGGAGGQAASGDRRLLRRAVFKSNGQALLR